MTQRRVKRSLLLLRAHSMPFRKPGFALAPPPTPQDDDSDDSDVVAVAVDSNDGDDDDAASPVHPAAELTIARDIRQAQSGEVSDMSYEDLETIRLLGKGASSRVYLKKHTKTGEVMALKELSSGVSDDSRRMAVNELKIAHKHAHQEYLVNFIGGFVYDGKICIALEFCGAGDLAGVIKEAKPKGGVPPSPLGAMTLQYLRGLQYLHREMKQVHRDLKPGNVMITEGGVCKISDFGISKQLEETGAYAMTQVRARGRHTSRARVHLLGLPSPSARRAGHTLR